MPKNTVRIYGDVSPAHRTDFIFLKAAFGANTDGAALEKMIERLTPILTKELAKRKSAVKSA